MSYGTKFESFASGIDPNKTIYFRQTWKDPRLALYYLNCSLNIDADFSSKIWLPDIYFINDKKSFMHDVTRKNRMFRIRSYFQMPESWPRNPLGDPPSNRTPVLSSSVENN